VAGVHFGNAILFISKISRAAHNFGVEACDAMSALH
jgi:hypothetical protein